MNKENVLLVVQEMEPFTPETEISKISKRLVQAILENGFDTRVFIPKYGTINERKYQLHEVIRLSGMLLSIGEEDYKLIIKVASIPNVKTQAYFIYDEKLYKIKALLTDEKNNLLPDTDVKAIFYARGILENVKKLRWAPKIVCCFGWLSSLVPIYIRKENSHDPIFKDSCVIQVVYPYKENGLFNKDFYKKIPIEQITLNDVQELTEPTIENLIKIGIKFSDAVAFVEPNKFESLVEYSEKLKKQIIYVQDKDEIITSLLNFFKNKCFENCLQTA